MDRTPCPPQVPRADVLGRLRRERWFAADAGETAEVQRLDREIEQLSAANTATAPARETAAATSPRATTARTNPKPQPTPKGNRRVSAR
jgi:hypothetical protein